MLYKISRGFREKKELHKILHLFFFTNVEQNEGGKKKASSVPLLKAPNGTRTPQSQLQESCVFVHSFNNLRAYYVLQLCVETVTQTQPLPSKDLQWDYRSEL